MKPIIRILALAMLLAPPGICGAQTFTAIRAASSYTGYLQVVGLGTNGYAYLPVYQTSASTWSAGGMLPGQTVAFSDIELAYGNGQGFLQVIGLGLADGHAYIAAYQDQNGNWHSAGALPGNITRFSQIAAARGASSNALNVVGLGTNGFAYVVASQDQDGSWYAGGLISGQTVPMSSITLLGGTRGELQLVGIGASDGKLYTVSCI